MFWVRNFFLIWASTYTRIFPNLEIRARSSFEQEDEVSEKLVSCLFYFMHSLFLCGCAGKNCRLRVSQFFYLVIDKPWYKPNTKETRSWTVYPPVTLLQHPQYLLSTIFGNPNAKKITLKETLNKLGCVPEELIQLTLDTDNSCEVLIQ